MPSRGSISAIGVGIGTGIGTGTGPRFWNGGTAARGTGHGDVTHCAIGATADTMGVASGSSRTK